MTRGLEGACEVLGCIRKCQYGWNNSPVSPFIFCARPSSLPHAQVVLGFLINFTSVEEYPWKHLASIPKSEFLLYSQQLCLSCGAYIYFFVIVYFLAHALAVNLNRVRSNTQVSPSTCLHCTLWVSVPCSLWPMEGAEPNAVWNQTSPCWSAGDAGVLWKTIPEAYLCSFFHCCFGCTQ